MACEILSFKKKIENKKLFLKFLNVLLSSNWIVWGDFLLISSNLNFIDLYKIYNWKPQKIGELNKIIEKIVIIKGII